MVAMGTENNFCYDFIESLNLLRNPDNYKLLKLVNKNYGNLYPYSNGLLSNQEQAFQFLKVINH